MKRLCGLLLALLLVVGCSQGTDTNTGTDLVGAPVTGSAGNVLKVVFNVPEMT